MAERRKGWVCSVCGYVHQGDSPPDVCPVCGAASELFEPHRTPEPAQAASKPSAWRCLNCEYVHDGSLPPDVCPVCGAPAERFERYRTTALSGGGGGRGKIVIAGAGIAGVSAAEAARRTSPEAEIILLSREDRLPYYRLNLTRYLAGEIDADLLDLHPRSWYDDNNLDVRLGGEVQGIEPDRKRLSMRTGETIDYDSLVLAVGSHAFVPPFAGGRREGVTVLRSRDDAERILRACEEGPRCVCIGGGLLGLETAGALARRGIPVTLLEGHGWLLPRQLNRTAGELLEKHAAKKGITIRKNARTKEILGDERVRGVALDAGDTVEGELVVIATGVRSNSYLARLAGVHAAKAVVVDDSLKTSVPGIYAAGDTAEHRGVMYGTWGPSQFMGSIAGINAAGGEAEFAGIARSNMLKVLGYDMFSIGTISPEDASYEIVEGTVGENYFYYLFHDTHMVGAILMGDTARSAEVKKIVENRIDCSKILERKPDVDAVAEFLE